MYQSGDSSFSPPQLSRLDRKQGLQNSSLHYSRLSAAACRHADGIILPSSWDVPRFEVTRPLLDFSMISEPSPNGAWLLIVSCESSQQFTELSFACHQTKAQLMIRFLTCYTFFSDRPSKQRTLLLRQHLDIRRKLLTKSSRNLSTHLYPPFLRLKKNRLPNTSLDPVVILQGPKLVPTFCCFGVLPFGPS